MIEQQIPQSVTIGAETPNIDFSFKRGEKCHPQKVVQRLFRVGPYLELPSEIPAAAPRSVAQLIELYQPQIEKKGKDSVAQLCPSNHDFEALAIKGLDLVCHRTKAKLTVHINTIDELRTLFEVLDESSSVRVFIHGTAKDTIVRADLRALRKQLKTWDGSINGQHQQEPQ